MVKYLILPILLFLSCASFQYRYYGISPIDGESLRGTLLGKKPSEDLPLSNCDPSENQKGKCITMFVEEFERLRTDMAIMEEKLKDCAVQRQ